MTGPLGRDERAAAELLARRLELVQADVARLEQLARAARPQPQASPRPRLVRAARRRLARVRAAVLRRDTAAPSVAPAPPPPSRDPRTQLVAMRQRPDGIAPSAAFTVADLRLGPTNVALDAAVGLAEELRLRGWRTSFHDHASAACVPTGTDVVVIASRFTDVRRLPGGAALVALVTDEPEAWASRDAHAAVDAWMASTPEVSDRLRAQGITGGVIAEPSDVAVDVVERVRASGPATRTWLGYFPDWRAGNPFLEMLYSRADGHGLVVTPVENPALVPPTSLAGDRDVTRVLHVHWSDAVAQSAPNEEEAWNRAESFADGVRLFRASGGVLVWTVHNVVPHDLRFPGPEGRVLDVLAAESDVVHVMGEETFAAVSEHYRIDRDRALVVPHPSYVGWYPDSISRDEARRRLGIAPDARVVLLLGQIREYKGIDTLLAALDHPDVARTGLTALVAGAPGNTLGVPALLRACEAHPRVVTRFERIPSSELQVLYKAADASVLPYRRFLNSGALMASLGFGTPVVAPRSGTAPSMVDEDCALLYDPDSKDGLAQALASLDTIRTPQARRAARRRADELLPSSVSDRFLSGLLERLGPAGRPHAHE